jgi:hypothetical protein
MAKPRPVIMQVVKRSSGSATHHVEFLMDDNFAERLRQLRSLVPPLGSLNKQRDLVIDKVRVRVPNAIWRSGNEIEADGGVDGSCIVIAAEGSFNCGGKDRKTREKLVTYNFSIARLLELHAERPEGEVDARAGSGHARAGRPVRLRHAARPVAAPRTSASGQGCAAPRQLLLSSGHYAAEAAALGSAAAPTGVYCARLSTSQRSDSVLSCCAG